WSFALALRLGSYELLRADSWGDEGDPILILDDVFAELDAGRRRRLAELVEPARQVLITAAVAEDIPTALTGGRIDVMDSEVARVQGAGACRQFRRGSSRSRPPRPGAGERHGPAPRIPHPHGA